MEANIQTGPGERTPPPPTAPELKADASSPLIPAASLPPIPKLEELHLDMSGEVSPAPANSTPSNSSATQPVTVEPVINLPPVPIVVEHTSALPAQPAAAAPAPESTRATDPAPQQQTDSLLETARKTVHETLQVPAEAKAAIFNLTAEVKDKLWSGAVLGSRGFAYASTVVVAATIAAQIGAAFADFNLFAYFHNHPVAAHIATVAHTTVMFLAASAGFGLWRFKQTQELIRKEAEDLNQTYLTQQRNVKIMMLQLRPLREFVTETHQEIIRAAFDAGAAESPALKELADAASNLNLKITILWTDPSEASAKQNAALTKGAKLAGLKTGYDAYLEKLAGTSGLLQPGWTVKAPALDLGELAKDLDAIENAKKDYDQLHQSLHDHLPIASTPEAHARAQTIINLLNQAAKEPGKEIWKKITAEAVQLEVRAQDVTLHESTREVLRWAVKQLQDVPEDATEKVMRRRAAHMSSVFVHIARNILDADPGTDQFKLLRYQLHNKLIAYERQYPNLSVRASVAGVVLAVSYWMCIDESLNSLIKTNFIYNDGYAAAKTLKHVIPFAVQAGIVLAAGAINNQFRPHVAWASLELSKWTLKAIAPFARLYHEGQELLGRVWERGEERAVRRLYRKRHSTKTASRADR